MKPRPRVWRFRLFPEPAKSRLYVRALVFDRRKDMLEFWRQSHDVSGRARASCAEVSVLEPSKNGNRPRLSPLIARVSLWRKEMDVGTITHEFGHAALAWARRRKLKVEHLDDGVDGLIPQNHPEERIAWALGHLTSQFVARAAKAGLYP